MKFSNACFRIIFVALASVALTACDDPETARRALDDAGFTDIETHGADNWNCGKDDTFGTKFTATNPRGKRVSGVVCSSSFGKGATIRF